MNKTNNTNAPKDAPEGVIDLGVASVETHGPRPGFEPVGSNTPVGISEE
ncbi:MULTISPECIES: benenodin family lasso peptide [unclassified Luteimonas]